jgi:hypothetical protein
MCMYNGMILIIKKGDWHTVCSHSVCDAERLQSLSPSKKWMSGPKNLKTVRCMNTGTVWFSNKTRLDL